MEDEVVSCILNIAELMHFCIKVRDKMIVELKPPKKNFQHKLNTITLMNGGL